MQNQLLIGFHLKFLTIKHLTIIQMKNGLKNRMMKIVIKEL